MVADVPRDMYDRLGAGYARQRRAEPSWEAAVVEALGSARSVVNVGAGTGSYEPRDREVLAVEPSTLMIRQREAGMAPAIRAKAEALPVRSDSFDVAMAAVTLHHWSDWSAGLREMQRVARRIVVLHFDPSLHCAFWLARDYLPELAQVWSQVPSVDEVTEAIGPDAIVRALPVPWDCVDGFLPAYWRRPAAYLDPDVQQSMSGLQLLEPAALVRGLTLLAEDLRDGVWHRRHAALLEADVLDVGWRLIYDSPSA